MGGRAWTKDEEEQFVEIYPTTPMKQLMEIFSRTEQALQVRAKVLKVKKNKKFIADSCRANMIGNKRAVGFIHSEETKKIVSEKMKTIRADPESKKRYRKWWDSLTDSEKEHVTGKSVKAMKKFWNVMTKEEKTAFTNERREKANKVRLEKWGRLSEAEKVKRMQNIRKGWQEWWGGLSEAEKIDRQQIMQTAASQVRPTSIEISVRNVLDALKVDYQEQKPIGRYMVDFFIPSTNTVIECDGDYWHNLPEVVARDKRKDEFLNQKGYRVIRLPEHKIKENPFTLVKKAVGS